MDTESYRKKRIPQKSARNGLLHKRKITCLKKMVNGKERAKEVSSSVLHEMWEVENQEDAAISHVQC